MMGQLRFLAWAENNEKFLNIQVTEKNVMSMFLLVIKILAGY